MSGTNTTWHELNNVWPWRRVLAANEAVTQQNFTLVLPTVQLHASFLSAHGVKHVKASDLLPSGANALPVEGSKRVYPRGFVTAFNLAWKLRLVGNTALSAFGVRELRASGWEETRK